MPESEWRGILERLDVPAYYQSEGIEIRSGKALCPFHPDTTPSMSVDPTRGLFNCHACGESGSVFDFYAKKHGVTFPAAVQGLASFSGAGTRTDEQPVPLKRPTFSAVTARNWWVNLRRSPEKLKYLHEQRGLTDETIDTELLGWTGRRYSIPIRNSDNTIINAKLYDPDASAGDKMLWAVAGTAAMLFVPQRRNNDPLSAGLVVEGEFDALVGAQAGLDTYSGTGGAGTWKKEWNNALPSKVVTLYDADEAGDKGAKQAAGSIAGSRKSVLVAAWPKGVAHGYDLTDWLVRDGRTVADLAADVLAHALPVGASLTTVAREQVVGESTEEPVEPVLGTLGAPAPTHALTFEEAVDIVQTLPHDLTPHALMTVMRSHLPRLMGLSLPELQMLYRGPLAAFYKKTVGRSHIPTLLAEATIFHKANSKKQPAVNGAGDEEVISDFKHMDLGQAFLDNTLYYTVTRGFIETVTMPDQVTTIKQPKFEAVFVSKEGMMKADTTALAQQKFFLDGTKPHVNFNESWESDPKVEFSWGWYLTHKTDKMDLPSLYEDVRDVFSRYLYVQDDPMFDTLACYTMMTYVYRIFRSVGYIWFRALRGSGKSRTLDIMQCLGFNSLKLIDPSDSFMYRRIAATSPLVLIDEAENMGAEQKQSLRTILNMGYMAGTGIGRSVVKPDEITDVQFDVFGPKVLASIGDPDPTIGDRCIVYDLERSPKNLPDFNSDRTYPKWVALRNRLHCYGLQYAHNIAVVADLLTLDDMGHSKSARGEELTTTLRNRDRQIWTPLLAVALLVDAGAGNIASAPLFTKMLAFAKDYVLQKQSSVGEESEFQVVMGIRHYVRNNKVADGWYNSGDLLTHIRTIEGVYEKYSSKRLNSLVFNKLKLGNAANDRKRKGGERAMFYHLDADLLERKCRSFMLPEEDMLSFRESPDEANGPTHGGRRADEEEPTEMQRAWTDMEREGPVLGDRT